MRHTDTLSNRRGLTLVEMLVATALTVFLLAVFSTLFVAATSGVSTIRGITTVDQKVRTTVNSIRWDLENIYLGPHASVGSLFSSENNGPATEGYFTIEENSPATYYPDAANAWNANAFVSLRYRQGVDQTGVPVEIDTDDVMAMVVRLPGTKTEEFFYGRVPALDTSVSPAQGLLDGLVAGVGSPFDPEGNGMYVSPMAEVVYFLRPNGHQYTLAETNNPPNSNITGSANPPIPALYTLYRRQLLVLSQREADAVHTYLANNSQTILGNHIPISGESYYQHYDVSVRWDSATGQLLFNTPATLARRANRFGMFWFTDAQGNRRELPFVPGANYINGIHNPASDPWFGRPTQYETTSSDFPADFPADPTNHDLVDTTPNDGVADRYDATESTVTTLNRRGGEDVVLTNVVSFDIKVFDDDFFQGAVPFQHPPLNPLDWPATQTAPNSSSVKDKSEIRTVTNPKGDASAGSTSDDTIAAPTLAVNPAVAPVSLSDPTGSPLWRAEFVDLGYRAHPTAPVSDGNGREQIEFDLDVRVYNEGPPPQVPGSSHWLGDHTPARWRTTGRAAAPGSDNPPDAPFSTGQPNPVATYDSWWSGYNWRNSDTNYDNTYNPTPGGGDIDWRAPPYERPLRGIQIKIRVLEPKTGIVREFTIVHRFK